jgi:glutathione synthase/RimK-type ligase-like ATP-grasp enzyme
MRRPETPTISNAVHEGTAQILAKQESISALRNLWAVLDCFWVSRPEAIRHAENKMHQLQVAASVGMDVPDTLVTTSPEAAHAFYQSHQKVIAKALGSGYVDDINHSDLVFTNLVGPEDVQRLNTVAFAPTMFQVLIPKSYDLRVTVVGHRVFATAIRSRNSSKVQVDWRREPLHNLHHSEHQLPPKISHRVIELVRTLGLQFAALDFIVTDRSGYVFLEVNPNGQWAWIEQVVGTPISAALVELLAGREKPL